VSAEDIMKLARKMFLKAPSVGCVGHDLSKIPVYSLIKQYANSLKVI
jgi:hypothetical protein